MRTMIFVAVLFLQTYVWASPVTLELEVPREATGVYFKMENLTIHKCDNIRMEMELGQEDSKPNHFSLTPIIEESDCSSTDLTTVGLFASAKLVKTHGEQIAITVRLDSDYVSHLKVYFKKP